ncbi:MAG: SPOR domain-containing protein [Candidatus Methylumidiphilus sp.]
MDYKNRIPGYRPPRPPRKKDRTGLWASLAVVVGLAAVAIGWALTRPKDAPPATPAPVVATSTTTTAVPLPDPNAAAKPDPKKTGKPGDKDAAKPASATPAAADPAAKPVEPRFTFYKILPELEAIIPESEIKNLKREESLGKKPPAVQYLLQAGSFTNVQDAEKLKARLSALKIKSRIENVKIENTAWNRVKIGPFTSLADADKVRTYLRNNQLDSVVQKSVAGGPAQQQPAPSR